jgi:dTDP-D-glucose 4,6-dehydratase
MRETVAWYLANQQWCKTVTSQEYDGRRLGMAK